MSRSEFIVPYESELSRRTLDQTYPMRVATQTADLLELYFETGMSERYALRDFFSGDPVDFVYRAEIGFHFRLQKFDMRKISQATLMRIHAQLPPFVSDDQAVEDAAVFDFLLVVLNSTPDIATHPLLPKGYSRRGFLKPPSTVDEFFDTTGLLRNSLLLISGSGREGNALDPKEPVEKNQGVWKTFLTFQTARDLELTSRSQNEIQDLAREQFNNILGDTSIDL